MHKREQDRFEVKVWMNSHGEIEMRVYDRHAVSNQCIAHLIEKDEVDEITEDGWYSPMWYETHGRIEEGYDPDVALMDYEEIDRDAPEHSENTLYWKLETDGHWWARHPLYSWQSMAASGEFVEWEVLYGEEALERAFSDLRDAYFEECKDEVAKLTP